MSTFFSGTYWKTLGFGSSMFHGMPAVKGVNFFSGDFWKASEFGTDFFHGPALIAGGKRYWAGRFWAPAEFSTTFFTGVPVLQPVAPPPSLFTGGAGGGQDGPQYGKVWNMPFPRKRRRTLELAVLAAIAEEDEL